MWYDRCAFPKKRRGVNVKGEPRLLENIFLVMLVILDVYLLSNVDNYVIKKKTSSTANYVTIEELISSGTEYEVSVLDTLEE